MVARVDIDDRSFRDDILKWDLAETVKGDPFREIIDVDIFTNEIMYWYRVTTVKTTTWRNS